MIGAITTDQYNFLLEKAKCIDRNNYEDIVHDAILKFENFDECIQKMFFEKHKYSTHNFRDLTKMEVGDKVCKKCNEVKPLVYFERYRFLNTISTKNTCKDCRYEYKSNYDKSNRNKVNQYARDKYKNDPAHKKMRDAYHLAYQRKNKDKVNAYQNERRRKEGDAHKEYMKAWRAKNKDILKKKRQESYLKNIEREKEYNRAYSKKYKEEKQKQSLFAI